MEHVACVLLKDRIENQVDLLLAEKKAIDTKISDIQVSCTHDHRLTEFVDMPPTQMEGVLDVRSYDPSVSDSNVMSLKCVHCSHEKKVLPYKQCPKCLTEMPTTGPFKRSEDVFGQKASFAYVAEIFDCTSCGCRVAKLTYDR